MSDTLTTLTVDHNDPEPLFYAIQCKACVGIFNKVWIFNNF